MQRLTISIDDQLARMFDRLVRQRGYENRSEAFRDLVRKELGGERLRNGGARYCVGTLSYVYDYRQRQLASRLIGMQHDSRDVAVSTMRAHLDLENCIETVILRGPTRAVTVFAQDVIAQTGVRHGMFHPIPVEARSGKARSYAQLRPHS